MNNRVLPLAAIAAAALSGTTSAQLDCSCSPQAFTLKINLSGTCPASITNVVTNNDDFCHVTKDDGTTPGVPADLFGFPSDQNFDEVPTEIESISYYELNESLEAISQDTIAVDGSVNEVTFTSVTANLDPELFLSEQTQNVVSAAFLVISGKNADGISVKNTVTWQYDLEMCDKIPMAIGDTIGWVDVVGLKYAKAAFCPVVPATMEPTASPTFEFHKQETTTEATATTPTSMSMSMGTKSSKHAKASSAKASKAKSSKTSTPGSYGAGEDPIANSKASTKSSKGVSAHTKSSKTVDTKVQTVSSASSYEYGGYYSMPKNSQDNKSGNSKHSTKSTKGTKSSKASSSKATTSVVAVNSKQSTKSSKTKSAKAVGTTDAKAKKPHEEGSMSTGWSAGGGRWLIDAGSYSYGAGKGPIANSKASTKSSKVVSTNTKSSKTVDTKVQKASSAGSYEYGGYYSMPKNSQDNKSGNSKHSTKSTKGTKSSKASSSIATTSVVAVNSKQSTKSSKTKSAKAVGTSDAKKPHEGSMSTGWSAGSVRW